MTSYVCMICGHEYRSDRGEPAQNIPPGRDFSVLPADWTCPVCSAAKNLFKRA